MLAFVPLVTVLFMLPILAPFLQEVDIDFDLAVKTLVWVLAQGGAGLLAYLTWENLEKLFPDILGGMIPEREKWCITLLTAIVGLAAYGGLIMFGIEPMPVGTAAMVKAIVGVFGSIFTVGNLIHAGKRKRLDRGS